VKRVVRRVLDAGRIRELELARLDDNPPFHLGVRIPRRHAAVSMVFFDRERERILVHKQLWTNSNVSNHGTWQQTKSPISSYLHRLALRVRRARRLRSALRLARPAEARHQTRALPRNSRGGHRKHHENGEEKEGGNEGDAHGRSLAIFL
jgi:hypothetical protein